MRLISLLPRTLFAHMKAILPLMMGLSPGMMPTVFHLILDVNIQMLRSVSNSGNLCLLVLRSLGFSMIPGWPNAIRWPVRA